MVSRGRGCRALQGPADEGILYGRDDRASIDMRNGTTCRPHVGRTVVVKRCYILNLNKGIQYHTLCNRILSQNLKILVILLHGQLAMAIRAVPARLLPPVLPAGQRPPKDVHEGLLALAAALNLCLCRLAALGAVDPLRLETETRQGNDMFARGVRARRNRRSVLLVRAARQEWRNILLRGTHDDL